MPLTRHRLSARPRSVRTAQVTAGVLVVLVLLGVVLPVFAVISGADATVAGTLDVPVGRIVVVGVLGLLLVAGLAVGLLVTSRPGVAWSLTAVLVVVALLTALYPLLATAQSAVDQGKAFVPWLTGLIAAFRG